ncbi:MAG: SHOCT domain-containing protein [Thiomicrospira sp.]|uniref:SHOCT domain-containing protein n=1 Tax=Thiomicrospira sp. TaxID=935 RepID=UPI0019FC4ADA|nr:SHOCT domain-containing protein [Thiomicrospira sp.]MBE0494636.1 SHOCT domain-containing protein [Thiomicrospira sp.]
MNWNFESINEFCGGGMMGGMWFFWLILLIIIVVFLFKLVGTPSKSAESAMELLKKRYANGEINKQEFEEIKKTLQS